jgi:hypothetical protein
MATTIPITVDFHQVDAWYVLRCPDEQDFGDGCGWAHVETNAPGEEQFEVYNRARRIADDHALRTAHNVEVSQLRFYGARVDGTAYPPNRR